MPTRQEILRVQNEIDLKTTATFKRVIIREYLKFLPKLRAQIKDAILTSVPGGDLMSHAPSRYVIGRNASLYGFFGFHAGENPLLEFAEWFAANTDIRFRTSRRQVIFTIAAPSVSDIQNNPRFLLPQTQVAWPLALEFGADAVGLSNLRHFLNKPGISASRSNEGIQLDRRGTVVAQGVMIETNFLSDVLSLTEESATSQLSQTGFFRTVGRGIIDRLRRGVRAITGRFTR